MTHIRDVLSRSRPLMVAATFAFSAVISVVPWQSVSAANALLDRSLTVSSTNPSDDNLAPDGTTYTWGSAAGQVPAGDPRNGKWVDHEYKMAASTAGEIEGFTIEYCMSAFAYVGAGNCTVPSGFTAAAWNGGSVTIGGAAYTINTNGVANFITLTQATGYSPTVGSQFSMLFPATDTQFFENPNEAYRTFLIGGTTPTNGTYFAHISTYSTVADANAAFAAATPNAVDEGTVTNSVTTSIRIYTRVQETLNFSVEGDELGDGATPAGATGCTALTAPGLINMGDSNFALSTTIAEEATSFFRLATNAADGTVVYYSGDTLKSGSNDINAIANTGALSTLGTEQFGLGINMDAGLVGDQASTLSALIPQGAYGQAGDAGAGTFAFDTASVATPRAIAQSTGIVNCETGRVDYVANISDNTPAGIYMTKINYIASPQY